MDNKAVLPFKIVYFSCSHVFATCFSVSLIMRFCLSVFSLAICFFQVVRSSSQPAAFIDRASDKSPALGRPSKSDWVGIIPQEKHEDSQGQLKVGQSNLISEWQDAGSLHGLFTPLAIVSLEVSLMFSSQRREAAPWSFQQANGIGLVRPVPVPENMVDLEASTGSIGSMNSLHENAAGAGNGVRGTCKRFEAHREVDFVCQRNYGSRGAGAHPHTIELHGAAARPFEWLPCAYHPEDRCQSDYRGRRIPNTGSCPCAVEFEFRKPENHDPYAGRIWQHTNRMDQLALNPHVLQTPESSPFRALRQQSSRSRLAGDDAHGGRGGGRGLRRENTPRQLSWPPAREHEEKPAHQNRRTEDQMHDRARRAENDPQEVY